MQVPHLKTALRGALPALEKYLLNKQYLIESWLRRAFHKTPPPITCSVDIRHAGFKITPVDTNLFPAGFNNLNPEFMPLCIQAAQDVVDITCPVAQGILIIPENHTRNPHYFESLAVLQSIFVKAGFLVRLGSLLPELETPLTVNTASGKTLLLEPVRRENSKLKVNDFEPCLILLNNDLSNGIPELLQGINQPIQPMPALSWAHRLKSTHFQHYDTVANEFAELIGIDPWLINPYFSQCAEVDFMQRTGETCLITQATALFEKINKKYAEYQLDQKPFLVVKADAGTYGMGVMMIEHPEDLQQLNRKQRTRMATSKGNVAITKVLLQEGVPTSEFLGEHKAAAEPVIYMLGKHVIGGFYRLHAHKSNIENLNSPGMQFAPLTFAECCNNPCPDLPSEEQHNRFYSYGVIGRLALLAAAREQEALP